MGDHTIEPGTIDIVSILIKILTVSQSGLVATVVGIH